MQWLTLTESLLIKSRAIWPSFFVLVSLAFALAVSILNGYVFWFIALGFLLLVAIYCSTEPFKLHVLSLALAAFVVLLYLNYLFIRPVGNAEALYLPSFLLLGFLLTHLSCGKLVASISRLIILMTCGLALWGLLQYFLDWGYIIKLGNRANAVFYTPNSFAAAINIVLLPTIALYAAGKKHNVLFYCVLLLFFALLASGSRGGYVAFATSIVGISVLGRLVGLQLNTLNVKKLAGGMILVFVVFNITDYFDLHVTGKSHKLGRDYSISENIEELARSRGVVSSLSHRFMLYDIAWQEIKKNPLTGKGFHTFRYYQLRDQSGDAIGNATRFVHNDYLQLWFEVGILGLVLFCAFPLIILLSMLKYHSRLATDEKAGLLAIMGGLLTFHVHALVDFLIYVPYLLLIYGLLLGLAQRVICKQDERCISIGMHNPYIGKRTIRLLVLILLLYLWSLPAIAQLAYDEAIERTRKLDIEGAIPLYEMARRLAPYETGYYWFEGTIWMNAARSGDYKESAALADRLFKRGMLNPFDVRNSLARAELHREFGYLLEQKAALTEIEKWNEQALYWRPNDPLARSEYLKTLMAMGKYQQVSNLLEEYLREMPDNDNLLQFKADLEKLY